MEKSTKQGTTERPKVINQLKRNPANENGSQHQSTSHSVDSQENESRNVLETSICCLCKNLGSYTIVECEECTRWFCFKCANLLIGIGENDPWSCDECVSKRLQKEEANQTSQKRQSDESTMETIQSNIEEFINENRQPDSVASIRTRTIQQLSQSNQVTHSKGSIESVTRKTYEGRMHEVHQGPIRPSSSIETAFEIVPDSVGQLSSTVNSFRMTPSHTLPIMKTFNLQSSVNNNRQECKSQAVPGSIIQQNIQSDQRSSRTTSTKKTSSSRSDIELQRLQEELELQEKFDEARMALKESRERKFLEEKFKLMLNKSSKCGDGSSAKSSVTRSSERPSGSLDRSSLDRNLSNRTSVTNKSDYVASWIEDQNQTTPSDIRQKRYDDKIDEFNFEYSISVDPVEEKDVRARLAEQRQLTCVNQAPRQDRTSIPRSQTFQVPIDPQREQVRVSQHNDWTNWPEYSMPPPQRTTVDNQNCQQPVVARTILNQPMPINQPNRSNQNHQPPLVTSGQGNIGSTNRSNQNHQPPLVTSGQGNIGSTNRSNRNHQPPLVTSGQGNIGSTIMSNQTQHATSHQGNIGSTNSSNPSGQIGVNEPIRGLTANQTAARHVISKKLPLFYGDPASWPEFFDKYTNTTAACGFDNTENLDRLFECLRGNARAIVKSQLTMPACVPSIMRILEEKFGRKELVVKALLKGIRDEPSIKADKLEALSNFGYIVQSVCQQIQRQGMQFYLYNPELVQEIVDKLPHQTKIEWARFSDNIQNVTLVTLSDWLARLSQSLNKITTPEVVIPEKKSDRKEYSKGSYVNAHGEGKSYKKGENNSKCEVCTKNCKRIEECQKFKGYSVEERWKFLYDHKKICRGCLQEHGRKCSSPKECGVRGCTFKHHAILHNDEKHSKVDSKITSQAASKVNSKATSRAVTSEMSREANKLQSNGSINAHRGGQSVLYKIVPVTLRHKDKSIITYAYLDDGSGLTILEKGLADELNLRGTPESLCLRWTSGTIRHEHASERVVLEISGVGDGQHIYQLREARTVNSLDLPKQTIDKQALIKDYPYLQRVPFEEFSAAPRILIGLDNVKLALSRESIKGGWTEPIVSKTLLGWVVHGPNGKQSNILGVHMQYHVMNISCHGCSSQPDRDSDLHQRIEEFFSLENFGTRALTSSVESKDVQRANRIMEGTISRKTNRFEIGLLWRYDDSQFPNNYQMALKRLVCQDKRMRVNPALMENINGQIKNFIAKGYARKLTPEEIRIEDSRTWYLPIFHHLDPKKPEKVRLVWDAAAKFKGMSLNSMMLPGPDNLVALIDILRRFRERRIAIGGDIEEMYHQIEVRKQDQNAQRFLWRDGNSNAVPDVYVMKVMTFGATCSPSIAQFVKNRNATEFENKHPEAARAIKSNHYVDDWLDSKHTVDETIQLAKDVTYIHKQGGFKLRKFISNSTEVLKALREDGDNGSKDLNADTALSTKRILGMWWNPQTDCFSYSLKFTKLNEEVLLGLRAPTKRETLKTLMSIYDPLGLIAFFLVYLKMLLQEIWKTKITWNEQLPKNLSEKWDKWIKLLPKVEEVRIPRLYSSKISPGTAKSIELHTFVDASENAYCAICYLRIIDEEGVHCVLVGAKTKVVPIKPILTIPRKELLAAVLGTRLASSVGNSLTIHIHKRQFWSDSRDVLCWIRSINRKYRQFVAFRVGEILETSIEAEWRFVPGKLNVADDGTKWTKLPIFSQNTRWFRGPEFLWDDPVSWPQDLSSKMTTNEEIHVQSTHVKVEPPSQINPEHFSSWSRMVNAQALSSRYVKKVLAKIQGKSHNGPLTSNEFKEAENTLYKLAQFDWYHEEITSLKDNQGELGTKTYIKKSSPLYKLSPYLAEDGLLRIRGRIDNVRGVKFDAKRPIILPRKHKITELVVSNYHKMFLHQNNETVVNELCQKFYIPKIRVVVKHVISKCQYCKNNRAKPAVPEMGDLPLARVSPGFRAFTYTGVDYFGPMYVTVKRSTEKRWGVLFTCLTIRAVHIEIAPSLTADDCILCVRNFVNLRGTPCEFWSDNGTNFTAADKELRKEFENMDWEQMQTTFTKSYTTWKFNPPASPHMSGSRERLIRSVKDNLKVVMPTRTPKPQLLESYLREVANIINSRPLTYMEIESNDAEMLTPNHFIFGSSNGIMAPGEFPYEEKSLKKNWRRSQELTNMFWRRWIKEYLPIITRRTKWFSPVKPVEIGDVVILVDEKNQRNCYPRGMVVEVKPDKYGQVRQATVKIVEVVKDTKGKLKTTVSFKTRPVAKMAVLDVAGKRKMDISNANEDVRSIGSSITKGPNEGENVGDGNAVTKYNKTTLDEYQKQPSSGRKHLFRKVKNQVKKF